MSPREEKLQALIDAVAERESHHRDQLAYDLQAEHRWSWRRYIETAEIDDVLRYWEDEDPQWPRFGRELMARLECADDLDEVDNPAPWAARAHEIATELPEWQTLADLCHGHRWDSGVGAMVIGQAVLRAWQDQEQKPDRPGGESSDGAPDGPGQPEEPRGAGTPGEPTDAATAQARAESGDDGAPGTTGDPGSAPGGRVSPDIGQLRRAIRDAALMAGEGIRETQEALGSLLHGTSGSGTSTVSPDERERLARALAGNAQLRRVLLEMGRLLRIATAKRKSDVHAAPRELVGVTVGRDIERTLPSELALLGHPSTRMEFFRRYAERQTLIYQTRGKVRAGRGPIVICLDVSGSMAGDRMTWAAATALALAHSAVRDGREAIVLPFDTCVHDEAHFTRATLTESTIAIGSLGADGGGTQWTVALDRAVDLIAQSSGTWETADIVLITDGSGIVGEAFASAFDAWKRNHGVTVYALLVEMHEAYTTARSRLSDIADQIIEVRSLMDDSAKAGDVIAAIKKGSE
jgi:Mg-chelatase subunit ChlD